MYGPFWTSKANIASKVLTEQLPDWESTIDMSDAGMVRGAADKAESGSAVYGVRSM
jgi:hypothetical protein